jgi:hydrogenase maturation protease
VGDPDVGDRRAVAGGGAVVVIGVGNLLRGDDGAGLAVARRVRAAGIVVIAYEGEPVGLIEAWSEAGAGAVVLVDAVSSGIAPAGSVHRFDASSAALPAAWSRSTSTHALGVAEAIELARAVGRLPRFVVAIGIEGAAFELGAGLSPAVEAVVDEVAAVVAAEAPALAAAVRAAGAARR